MIHQQLNMAHWKALFPLTRLRQEAGGKTPEACIITGPYDIAVLEQLREATYANLPGVERIPTDLFVWSRGEPEERAVTKIGGLPYRVVGKPWPVTPSGTAMTFVAQISFVDSRDITPSLPGDILLLFAEAQAWDYGEIDATDISLEWTSLSTLPLITSQDIPETGWDILLCFGAIHRTWDYPSVDGFAYPEVTQHIPPVFEATKIGGACPWLDEEEETEGTFLCTLSSIHPEIYQPYPFLNVPEPISWDEWSQSKPLMIGDVGLMNFFLRGDGSLRWTMHTH